MIKKIHPQTKFLTVVWGDAYIARFAGLALPSFLAPGNLPALAEATDLEMVIMTRQDDIAFFKRHAAFLRLRAICPVRFVTIDDLITTGVYGVTLTLAYARPIIACGREMLNTHFVFMNADFVLADGSLRSLCRHINEGRAIVLGPSFRATAEAVEPKLEAALDKNTNTLTLAPRVMAGLAMPHPHATTSAKIFNQGLCHATHPNQFFWRVDENTLLGRYYLIFMLCLKPERVIDCINSYCDYALIPEMCPSGDEVAMDDSDEFFMLELQKRDQESEMLCFGWQSIDVIAKSLQGWTTSEHRRAARHNIILHTQDIPIGIDAAKNEAQIFIDNLQQRLGKPLPHARHPYWIRGVAAWKVRRKSKKLSTLPLELGSASLESNPISLETLRHLSLLLLWFVAYKIRQPILQREYAGRLSPYWADDLLLRDALAAALDHNYGGGAALVIRNNPGKIDPLIKSWSNLETMRLYEALNKFSTYSEKHLNAYRCIFIYLAQKDFLKIMEILDRLLPILGDGGRLHLVIHSRSEESDEDLSPSLIALAENLGVGGLQIEQCLTVGNAFKAFNRNLFRYMRHTYVRQGSIAFLWTLPLLTIALALTWISNHLSKRNGRSQRASFCSSIAIHLSQSGESRCAD
jgi:hypothetical protein